MSLETVLLENKSVSALNVVDTVDDIYQLLVASFSCEPNLYFFTGKSSEPYRFRHHVALGMLSLLSRLGQDLFNC